MIHYQTRTMPNSACKVTSPQATSERPLAVNCPRCKVLLPSLAIKAAAAC